MIENKSLENTFPDDIEWSFNDVEERLDYYSGSISLEGYSPSLNKYYSGSADAYYDGDAWEWDFVVEIEEV